LTSLNKVLFEVAVSYLSQGQVKFLFMDQTRKTQPYLVSIKALFCKENYPRKGKMTSLQQY